MGRRWLIGWVVAVVIVIAYWWLTRPMTAPF